MTSTSQETKGLSEQQQREQQPGGESGRRDEGQGGQGRGLQSQRGGTLQTDQGRTMIADTVVAKVAGVAAREIGGVHDMGKGTSRMIGSLRERMPMGSDQPSMSQGVAVEVGETQAAIDLDLVVEYGAPIVDVSTAVRRNVIQRVERMTGLEVTEVNIAVDDVWLQESDDKEDRRVQ